MESQESPGGTGKTVNVRESGVGKVSCSMCELIDF
jgi:hypothetical protein